MKNAITMSILFLLVNIMLYGQDGALDVTFDADGKVTTSIGSGEDEGYAIAIQSDDKIVVAGYSNNGSDDDFALVRYNANGSLDNTFGSGGKVTTAIGTDDEQGYGVAIQTDGKIVVVGYSYNGSNRDFAVVRYNTNGSLDNTFGSGGKVTTAIGTSHDCAESVEIQTDGKIVVAGYSRNGSIYNFALVRYNANGSLDNTFGSGGKVTTAIGTDDDYGESVAIQSDGRIVVAGYSYDGSVYDFALVRYNVNGSLDNTFGSGGIVVEAIGAADDYAKSVAIQADGKIVVAGYSYNGTNDNFVAVRYLSNGILDNSFDSDGVVITGVRTGYDYAYSIAIQANGKIIVAGSSYESGNFDIGVVRYNDDGSLDENFDLDGKVTTPIGTSHDSVESVAIQSDGKIVVAGYTNNGSNNDFVVVRYNNPSLPVELTSFTAKAVGNNIQLNWQTATEVNNYGFSVERSVAQISNLSKKWEEISFIEGHGNSNSPKKYSFIDTDISVASTPLSYRLKQMDIDGAFEYSEIVSVEVETPKTFKLSQNYPNPFNPSTIISYSLSQSGKVVLKVFNSIGEEVAELVNKEMNAGNYSVKFDATNLSSGIYFYRISAGNFVKTNKMLLIR